ncbi:hypothetical protein ACWCXE_05230 [Streptomyces sp. NPDC001780]
MTKATPALTFAHHAPDRARKITDELTAVYAEVYDVPRTLATPSSAWRPSPTASPLLST